MRRPDWTHRGWWRWRAVKQLVGETLTTKLDPNEFGGGRRGDWIDYADIQQHMCSLKGCGRRAQASWAGCADDNINRPLCPEHDVQINLMALAWWGDPQLREKMNAYVSGMEDDIGRPVERWAYDENHLWAELKHRLEEM